MTQTAYVAGGGKYPRVAEPLRVGSAWSPNRVVFPAWQLNYAGLDGGVTQKLMDFYSRLAAGGCGLIFTGCAVVSGEGVPFNRVMRIDTDNHIPGLQNLFRMIKAHGAAAGIQLVHYGRQSSTSLSGYVLMAPSAVPCPVMSRYDPGYRVREMTRDDIRRVRKQFIDAAKRAEAAGVQVVEIHAAHGYLLSEFLSPYSNYRADEYGGSAEKRARLVVEIIQGVREALDGRVAISVRVNGHDFVPGGLVPEDYREIAPMLEDAGADMINVSCGVYESMERITPPLSLGDIPHAAIVAAVRSFCRVPVCGVGSIMDLETAESLIASDRVDLCAMGRAQTADPEIARKSFESREAEIRRCLRCNQCAHWTTGDPEMYCAVNPDYKKPA